MIELKLGELEVRITRYDKIELEEETITIYSKRESLSNDNDSYKRFIVNNKKEEKSSLGDLMDDTPVYLKQESPIGENFSYEVPKDNIEVKNLAEIEYNNSVLRDGAIALRGMIEGWAVGYRKEVEQPDRQRILLDSIESDGGKMLKYIDHTGGLTHAIVDCTELEKPLARDIAMNICQVSSILFPPLAELCEFKYKID